METTLSAYYLTTLDDRALPSFLQTWLQFLVNAFSAKSKPPSRSYFLNHLTCDPYKSGTDGLADITVLVRASPPPAPAPPPLFTTKQGFAVLPPPLPASLSFELLSTYRLFNRTMTVHSLLVKGLGEVATSSACRGSGFATALLKRLIEDSSRQQVILLHASGEYKGYYAKLGFKPCSSVGWSRFPLAGASSSSLSGYTLNDTFTAGNLQHLAIHSALSSSVPLVARSADYFDSWMKSDGERWGRQDGGSGYAELWSDQGIMVAWAVVRVEEGTECYQVRDFGCGEGVEAGMAIRALVARVVQREGGAGKEFKLPNKVAAHYSIEGGVEDAPDDGWMYHGDGGEVLEQDMCMWPSDSF